jgi:intergrase/recombinase
MDMRFCRKVFASYLHQCGIASEAIDFLQGRTSTSVLTRHYLTPDASLENRVMEATGKLNSILEK